jgi:pimeloyl-ACP methyl ester carboxylesterase
MTLTHQTAIVNGLRFHYVEAGSGPLVVLLHGFPEFWYTWRHQLPALAAAGHRAVAPDLRGYNESAKPPGVRNYVLDLLVADVAGLIAHLGGGKPVAVVGHDWGGALAWRLAMLHPDLVERLVVLNGPHPAKPLWSSEDPVQWLRSWYILFFQLPLLPEWLIQAGNFALLDRMFRREPTRPGAFTREDIRPYKRALSRPGALTATINWYRAAFRYSRPMFRDVRVITAPTLLIWGERDPHLGVHLSRGLERWVPGIRVERLPHCSHWVQHDDPQRVNALLLDFLRG